MNSDSVWNHGKGIFVGNIVAEINRKCTGRQNRSRIQQTAWPLCQSTCGRTSITFLPSRQVKERDLLTTSATVRRTQSCSSSFTRR